MSLCNVIYNLVSQTLANRLKLILDTIISLNQSVFVPGRLITDNAILGFESMHKIKSKTQEKKGNCAFKLDMSTAYDRVEWVFLEKIMLKMGFCSEWVAKIMNCVKTAKFSVPINGHKTGLILPQKGLRQGCLPSPYLFLLCFEGLTSLLSTAEARGDIHGLKISRFAPLPPQSPTYCLLMTI